jgi:foldase protein PrsA
MRGRTWILALGAFFVLAIAGCGSGVPGDSVADVAGNPITTQSFNHWMYVAAKSEAASSPGQPVIVPNDPPNFTNCVNQVRKAIPTLAKQPTKTLRGDCKQLFTSLSTQVMDFLIKAYWYQATAAKLHIKVTNAQVTKALDAAKAQQFPTPAQYQNFLTQTGQTQQDILYRFRINQIFMKLLARQQKTVTPAQIAAYYAAHTTQFGVPEKRDIRIALTKTLGQANAAKAALAKHQSWTTVAKKYSTDPTTKDHGGLLVGVTKGEEDQALDAAAFSAPLNQVLGPVKGQFGYYVFEVTKISKGSQQSLTQASAQIKQTLTSQAQTTAQTAVDNQSKKFWRSRTQCRSGYAMADCSGYKAPKSSSSSTSTG